MNTTPAHIARRSSAVLYTAVGTCAAVVGALVVALILSLTGHLDHATAAAPATSNTPAAHTASNRSPPSQPRPSGHAKRDPHPHHGQPGAPGHPAQQHHPTPVTPSPTVVTLQKELGQLNYYEGPVDGIMGPQTVQSIQYLQRDAGLPQTGQMNSATQAALANFLAHRNNQMAG